MVTTVMAGVETTEMRNASLESGVHEDNTRFRTIEDLDGSVARLKSRARLRESVVEGSRWRT